MAADKPRPLLQNSLAHRSWLYEGILPKKMDEITFFGLLIWEKNMGFGINMANCLQLILSLTLSQTNSELNKYKPVHNRKSQNDSSIIMTQSLLYLFICLVLLCTVLTEFRANVWNSRHTSGQHYDLKSLCGIKGGLSDFLLKKCQSRLKLHTS